MAHGACKVNLLLLIVPRPCRWHCSLSNWFYVQLYYLSVHCSELFLFSYWSNGAYIFDWLFFGPFGTPMVDIHCAGNVLQFATWLSLCTNMDILEPWYMDQNIHTDQIGDENNLCDGYRYMFCSNFNCRRIFHSTGGLEIGGVRGCVLF